MVGDQGGAQDKIAPGVSDHVVGDCPKCVCTYVVLEFCDGEVIQSVEEWLVGIGKGVPCFQPINHNSGSLDFLLSIISWFYMVGCGGADCAGMVKGWGGSGIYVQ